MEEVKETSGKSGVEVVRVPGHPVMAVVDVGVGVVPRPVDKLDGDNIVRNVHQNCYKTHRERLAVLWEIQSGDRVGGVVNKCGI